MSDAKSEGVRPTRGVLEALRLPVPPLTTILHELDEPLIKKAQSVPDVVRSGKGERILALHDRVWFKVKRARQRGAATCLSTAETRVLPIEHQWWLGAAGMRRDDSPQDDFYAQLKVYLDDSTGLLPDEWDERRLLAEAGTLAARVTRAAVRGAVAEALRTGEIVVLGLGDRDVRLRIRVLDDGEAYLAVSFRNTVDEKFLVAVLGSIPGVAGDDWQVEPTSPLQLPLEPGEMVWSTLLSTEVQRALLAGG
jgi:hypothetical protein